MYTVYKHTAPNGKVYIGITGQKPEYRWNNGNGYKDNPHFYSAIRKYTWKNFKHEIVIDGLTKEQACDLEIELIEKYHARDPRKGYNILVGGECGALGLRRSAGTRKKISEANKRRHLSSEARHKISESHKGILPSAETRLKMSESHKGANHQNYGKHLSAETRRKIGESNKGKHRSAETRLKMSESHKGKIPGNKGSHPSSETRRKMSESHKGKNTKAVICVETGTVYSSVGEAAKSIGVTRNAIGCVLRGVTKTSGGYHWKYAD